MCNVGGENKWRKGKSVQNRNGGEAPNSNREFHYSETVGRLLLLLFDVYDDGTGGGLLLGGGN